jgi:hypothetical protein
VLACGLSISRIAGKDTNSMICGSGAGSGRTRSINTSNTPTADACRSAEKANEREACVNIVVTGTNHTHPPVTSRRPSTYKKTASGEAVSKWWTQLDSNQ